MLNDDWTTWANTEREALECKARFSGELEFTKKNIEALSQIIEAGDRKQKNDLRSRARDSSARIAFNISFRARKTFALMPIAFVALSAHPSMACEFSTARLRRGGQYFRLPRWCR
jgi:hypothetical protein